MDENTPIGRADGGDRYGHLIEHIQDAVVEFELTDGVPVVVGVNRAFTETFGYEAADARGEVLNDLIVPVWLRDEAHALDDRTSAGEITYQRVKRETADGLREFLYRGIPYADDRSDEGGFAVYTDLSGFVQNERRARVMNRVLRHNLRNKANVIVSHTARLLDAFDGQSAERTDAVAAVERAADALQRLTEEAGEIHRVLNAAEVTKTIDCVPTVRRVVETHRRESPDAAIDTDLPTSMAVRATGHLDVALDSLVDNAIRHNPSETPRVRVRVVAEAPGWTTVHVEDDGPPIPADERDVVTGDAEITPTRHGSGLGLWLVKWTVETFGGELSFDESDLGGNDVRVRLPRP
ncbi:PAS domain-containing sensor histidine kinase [Halarchaeum nitratireducens]|uniref:histidine kinase n=1 Tax=Halarchaeum nitratireducens TaxID=489913 RepID=A0A830G8A4_9EURY|nr:MULTISPECIES: PAS domain-containing sensor histidine kinase [Halarchaeum]MBP2250060.1 PAS domain S-box-containing protein [Halarchaeum solikamskense]GGN08745.1 hypothetical protein GCM10009021_05220 [Halarchaeum nitratireducens]